ncbi:hypothetical protein HKX54_10275 [Sulfitobacter sp. M57]|uniref:hypothetical protein n=1 Tax=unclassified Sulfitobacter TaxID=196795 RepID=UPI0023E0A459|nr:MULTISPECIES: hypothetical protein [unclassified Sulfitobacter]MDF3414840.1 hypothetical protein [Sulfitobacter sp. KE5]MDF3422321.1 hypothetical protein [Sulfitobacter sp. KE43]MDF3433386.1 hypothetical protein [Sulfitobacter sp. KE42]MDF3459026.1 hypothetical protein [Sulfitobacter sp. S74]MDF3462925.1 hypothetical protein [Sulfitobacter sp. Ks18]
MNIVEHIWSNTLELREPANLPPLSSILASLLAAPMVCFASKGAGLGKRPIVSYAGDEVLPGASLADVLFEEFGIEICDRTIVLIEPVEMGDTEGLSSQSLGQALGQVLVDLSQLNQAERAAVDTGESVGFVHRASQSRLRPELANLVQ